MLNYTCEVCGGDFISDRPEEDAIEEARNTFGEIPEEHRAKVCDDCYTRLLQVMEEDKRTQQGWWKSSPWAPAVGGALVGGLALPIAGLTLLNWEWWVMMLTFATAFTWWRET